MTTPPPVDVAALHAAAENRALNEVALPGEVTVEDMRRVLRVHREFLRAAGLLRDDHHQIGADEAESAARFLAHYAAIAGLPRWEGDNWRQLVDNPAETRTAEHRAVTANQSDHALVGALRDARRVLEIFTASDKKGGDQA